MTRSSKTHVCLDGRRLNERGGIGRITQEILRALAGCQQIALSLICSSTVGDASAAIRRVPFEASTLSLAEYQQLPVAVAATGCHVFVSPQFYAPPTVTTPMVSWVHDTWPLRHPEWLPSLTSVFNAYGQDSRTAGALVVAEYARRRQAGELFPENLFLADADRGVADPLYRFVVAAFALNLERSVCVVTCSRTSYHEITDLFPEARSKIRVIYNPAPAFALARQDGGYQQARPTLLHVSKWEPRKNVPALIRAFRMLLDDHPDVRLCLVGAPVSAASGEEVYAAISSNSVQRSVEVVANIPDQELASRYAMATGFVMPSLYEGFSIPLLEAFAFALPVAAAARGAIPEIAGDGALFFDPADERAMARAMEAIVFDSDVRSRLKERAAHRLVELARIPFAESVLAVLEEARERGARQ
jgi:glycosyltransferase involved in cell wall biosynthesis